MKNSDCLRSSIAIMQCTGVWVPDRFAEHPRNLYYIIFAVGMQGLIFVSTVLAEISYLFLVLGNTEKTVDVGVLLLSHLVQGVKVATILIRQDRIKKLIKTIDGPNFTHRDPAKRAIVESLTRVATVVGNVILLSAGVTALFWTIVPALNEDLVLPLRTAYPFDITVSPMFEIMYAYSSVSVSLVGVGDAAENFLVSGLLTLAGVQLDVLCHELAAVKTHADSKTVYKEVVACVKYHQDIIKYVEELASVFGLPIFCQFVTSSVVLCMAVFKITLSNEPIEIITMAFYIICVFMELLMYSFPGDLLLNKSLAVSQAAYAADWVRAEPEARRALLMTSLRAQKPLGIRAGGMSRVCLPTAARVVQTSYSYYALLKNTHEK